MVNPVGTPRKHDRMKIAHALIEWAKQDDAINLNKFAALHCDPPMPVSNLSRWAAEDPEFRQSYETAKSFLAFRREEWVSSDMLHVKAYDLNASAYDLIVRENRRSEAKYDSDLK